MSLKKGKAAIADLLSQMKVATSTDELEKLAHKAHGFVTFAELDDKSSRISKSDGNKLSEGIDTVKSKRLEELASA